MLKITDSTTQVSNLFHFLYGKAMCVYLNQRRKEKSFSYKWMMLIIINTYIYWEITQKV